MEYKCLKRHFFSRENYKIVPVRSEDKYLIMQWRNEQIYHLRQNKPLVGEEQEHYFQNVVSLLFEQEKPSQILFSYLENDVCIGYGGLVHINWIDKHAEVSFIINTELENDFFEFHWLKYLSLIEQVAFEELNFHKIFTFAFDLRPHLYQAVEKAGFTKEAVLKEHFFWKGSFISAVIHSKIKDEISLRTATEKDLMLYFEWTNDEQVRSQSFNSDFINLETHTKWFLNRLKEQNSHLYVFESKKAEAIGQVRIEKDKATETAVISVSIDKKYRGKGWASIILRKGVEHFLDNHVGYLVEAHIKANNESSIKSFLKAGFIFDKELTHHDFQSLLLIYKTV